MPAPQFQDVKEGERNGGDRNIVIGAGPIHPGRGLAKTRAAAQIPANGNPCRRDHA